MTNTQKQLVRESYDLLRPMAVPVTLLFYGRLFELDPALRGLFRHDMREQSRKLVETLSILVESLHDFPSRRIHLRRLGADHYRYGARREHYETLIGALLWAFGQALQQEFPADTRAAWRATLEMASAEMIAGAEQADLVSEPCQ